MFRQTEDTKESLQALADGLDQVIAAVIKNPRKIYDMSCTKDCIIGVNYGSFVMSLQKIFRTNGLFNFQYTLGGIKSTNFTFAYKQVNSLFVEGFFENGRKLHKDDWLLKASSVRMYLQGRIDELDKGENNEP